MLADQRAVLLSDEGIINFKGRALCRVAFLPREFHVEGLRGVD